MRFVLFSVLFLLIPAGALFAQQSEPLKIYGNACEKIIEGESKSSTRVRAADKAVFLGVKKLQALDYDKSILNEHDINVFVYRLVDEYVEDLSVSTIKDEGGKVCVEVTGRLNPQRIYEVRQEFVADDIPLKEAPPETVAKMAEEAKQEVSLKPDNPESLALVYIGSLEFYNGTKSSKYSEDLKHQFTDNLYFYLTNDAEIADYIVTPKILKAKVDKLDAGNKRLQMVVSLEISGLDKNLVSEYQNRFVLFGAEEDEQKIASRLMAKLIKQAGEGALRKIEHNEQVRLEQKKLGRSLSQ